MLFISIKKQKNLSICTNLMMFSNLLHSYNYRYELLIVCNVSHTQLIVLFAQFYTYL